MWHRWIALSTLGAVACVSPDEVDRTDCLPVGALLPFTGGQSSTGTNIERALILAAELVNDAGGVGGQPICILARDTHSDIDRGLDAARELVNEDEVVALFGPQDDDLALRVVSIVRNARVIGISGGTTSPALRIADDDGLWFRTIPSALVLGRALAERMIADGVANMSVLYEGNEFGVGWASVLDINFTLLGGDSHGIYSFQPDDSSFLDRLQQVFAPGVEAVVLAAHPSNGAAIVEEWSATGLGGRFYFTPPLNDQVFLDNIPPGVAEEMVGISPAVGSDASELDELFAERWNEDRPLRTAYFYFDALLLWAIAYEAAGSTPSASTVGIQLQQIASPPGEEVTWQSLATALARVRAGDDIDFVGTTGTVDLDDRGDVEGGAYQFWRVTNDAIVNE